MKPKAWLVVLLALAAGLWGGSPGSGAETARGRSGPSPDCGSVGPGSPIPCIYQKTPNFSFQLTGDFATGLALADINGDGYDDLVVANGNDFSPQLLKVYYNRSGQNPPILFNPLPDWSSVESAYRMGIAVGDVNGDGWLDVAVAIPFNSTMNPATGGIEIFLNRGGQLESWPSYRTADAYMALQGAFADVDADGDLDLVAAAFLEGPGVFPTDLTRTQPGRARIYLNNAGALATSPAWLSGPLGAEDVIAADINQDGRMDLAFSAPRASVFYGGPPGGAGQVPLPFTPSWQSAEPGFVSSYSIDAGFLGKSTGTSTQLPQPGSGLMLAVSSGCMGQGELNQLGKSSSSGQPGCQSFFSAYLPRKGSTNIWKSQPVPNASKLLLADLNADGILDMVADQWGVIDVQQPQLIGGPLWFFQGSLTGFPLPGPTLVTQTQRVGEGLAAGDLTKRATVELEHTFTATQSVTVLTLPQRIVRVSGVERKKNGGWQPLSALEYAFAPGNNWVSLARPLLPGETAKVVYETSPVMDVVEAVLNPQWGNDIYLSFISVTN